MPKQTATARGRRLILFTPGVEDVGGAGQHARLLAAGLARCGWRITVISREATPMLPTTWSSPDGYRVIALPGLGISWLGALVYLLCAPVAALAAGGKRAPLISLQLSSPTFAAGLARLLTGAPHVAFSFSSGERGEAALLPASRGARLKLWLLRRASALVGQTNASAVELRSLAPGTTVSSIPNPLALPRHVPPLNGQPRAAFSGRFTEGKGLDDLLEAWLLIGDGGGDHVLTLLGGSPNYDVGPWRSVEAEIVARVRTEPALASSVLLPGWVDDVPDYLARSDLYVFPSESEGLSNSLLEACALGRVVVASDIPANRAVLGDAYPLYFEVSNVAMLADRIRAALADERLRTTCRGLVLEAARLFDVARVAKQVDSLIRSLEQPKVESPGSGHA